MALVKINFSIHSVAPKEMPSYLAAATLAYRLSNVAFLEIGFVANKER